MSKYQQFEFKSYYFDKAAKKLILTYKLASNLEFIERYWFDFDFVKYNEAQLDKAFQNLFFMAGISYYKTYLPPIITVNQGELDEAQASFFCDVYQKGLGEFFYHNKLDPKTAIPFKATTAQLPPVEASKDSGILIGIGGGKDSLLSVELLRKQPKVATWSLDHREQLQPLIQTIGLPHFWVRRDWDRNILDLNAADALNGHIPISAIFACVGTIVSILTGYKDAIVSNENSANEPTLHYEGVDINHQYSKSLAFEQSYQELLSHCFGDSLGYFSFLRPLSELRISELFAYYGFDIYRYVFSSCNRAFAHSSHSMFWCGNCPKCAFVFLILTPFIDQNELEALWHGKNLLLDPKFDSTYRQLLGIEGDKPLDCVGEIKECRAAMHMAQAIYPELARKYRFELPTDYDYKKLAPHSMPEAMYDVLKKATTHVAVKA